jgi:hypothetical protein
MSDDIWGVEGLSPTLPTEGSTPACTNSCTL